MRARRWADDFDGPAGTPPAAATWGHETGGGGWGDAQLQTYTADPANAALDGEGRLAIVARPGPPITSARLNTKGRVAVRHGRVEARIRVPAARGAWAAFWMVGTDIDAVGWPACGEIDVMEVVRSAPGTVHATVHGPGHAGVGGGIGAAHDAGVDLGADFHVYGVDWRAGQITWRLDGAPYRTLRRAEVPPESWVFDREMYLLLNLAVGGDWPGHATDDPGLPATMLVDWVRVDGAEIGA